MVSHRSRAGWSAGMLSASKLSASVSTSGLSTTTKPNWPRTRAISRSVSRMGCRPPRHGARPGSVTSSRSAARRASSATDPRRSAALREGGLDRLPDGIGERADLRVGPQPGTRRCPPSGRAARPCGRARRSRPSASSSGVDAAATAASAESRRASSWARNDRQVHGVRRPGRYWAFATSTMRVNVAASRTATSARILRSRAMPASFRARMSLL